MNKGASLYEEGKAAFARGDQVAAYRCFREAVVYDATIADAWVQMGDEQRAGKNYALAAAMYRKALAAQDNTNVRLLLGQALSQIREFEEAISLLRQVRCEQPSNPIAHESLAYTLLAAECRRTAIGPAMEAIKLAPDMATARWLLSHIYLAEGEWREGWKWHEARLEIRPSSFTPEKLPVWDGSYDRSVVIYCEQGFGDIFQFARFLPRALAKQVALYCPAEMKALLLRSFPNMMVFGKGEPCPIKPDCMLALCSLPLLYWDDNFSNDQYLRPRDCDDLPRGKGIDELVGIVWQGDPGHPNDHYRSAKAQDFIGIARPGVEVYSLQLVGLFDPALVGPLGLYRGVNLKDWDDTASIISKLDRVICVDTGVGHLAGALGVKVDLLLPYGAVDWRWGYGDRTPWYPGHRLWRQEKGERWSDVINRVI